MLSVLLITLGILLLLTAIAGCVLPVLPGPPIALLALVALSIDRGWDTYSVWEWALLVGLVAFVTAADFIIPVAGARKFGASRLGLWLSVAGMIVGLLAFPPFGMLLGAFVGALLGELLAGKKTVQALKPAWGIFLGTVVGTGLKLAVCGIVGFYFFAALVD